MTPGMEYLIRHRLVEDMAEYPLSLFLEGAERISITFDRKGNTKLLVRKFYIDRAVIQEALPPCEEFIIKTSSIFSDKRIVTQGFLPLQYTEEPVEHDLNSPRRPIEVETYNYYSKNLLNGGFHRSTKENWLWSAFYRTYILPFENRVQLNEHDIEEHLHQLNAKDYARKNKHLWTHWLLWKRIVLPDGMTRLAPNSVAGELVFTPAYLDLNLARAVQQSCSDCS